MTTNQLPDNVVQAIERGHVIEAIRLLREATGLGLKEAKDVVDEYMRGNPVTGMGISSGGSRVGSVMMWVAALLVIALAVYYFRKPSEPVSMPVAPPPPIAEVAKPVLQPLSKDRLSTLPAFAASVNGQTKPSLLVSISPEPYRTFAIAQARKQSESTP